MERKKTHYDLLGVKPDVSASDVKRAYRQLVKDFHPDLGSTGKDYQQKLQETEYMMLLNDAYETLRDASRRLAYDRRLGLSRSSRGGMKLPSLDEEAKRERYLKKVFNPLRRSISKVLNLYQTELANLSYDIYDDQLVAAFERYADQIESCLRHASQSLTDDQAPPSLSAAVAMMRYSIAQAADGLEEMRRFVQNFDYDHLSMADNLFRIAGDLSRQSAQLSRGYG